MAVSQTAKLDGMREFYQGLQDAEPLDFGYETRIVGKVPASVYSNPKDLFEELLQCESCKIGLMVILPLPKHPQLAPSIFFLICFLLP